MAVEKTFGAFFAVAIDPGTSLILPLISVFILASASRLRFLWSTEIIRTTEQTFQ
jgi:hypothetical protein